MRNETTVTAAEWDNLCKQAQAKCRRGELMRKLQKAQCKNQTRDIMTITALMKTNEELEAHLNRNI
jgi:hypothetical protein